jgi:3-methyladenine DNA glycosylase/8-oxoguanine DNA glycosylase
MMDTAVLETFVGTPDAYDWPRLRAWLAARAIPGIEAVDADVYRRTWMLDGTPGTIELRPRLQAGGFSLRITTCGVVPEVGVVARVRRALDLDRDLEATTAALGRDPWLASAMRRHPGLRVPGGWEPFELGVRAVLGQQVTVAAARQLGAQLVARSGVALPPVLATDGLTSVFPTPTQLATADLTPLKMPGARRATLTALAAAVAADASLFDPDAPLDVAVARLRGVKGIGEWTAQYVALRALRAPDAFPASDVGLLRGAARETGVRPTPAALLARAERWRPYRAYAAQVLWAEDGEG